MGGDRFPAGPTKAYIFYAIRFLYASQKKSWNKLCLEPHDTYILFRTFFSHVNIKWLFFYRPIPLILLCFDVFSFSWKVRLFLQETIFSHSFWPRWLKQTSFKRKLNALHRAGIFFFVFPSVSIKKKIKKWKNRVCIKMWKVGKFFSKFYFSKILKIMPVTLCSKAL